MSEAHDPEWGRLALVIGGMFGLMVLGKALLGWLLSAFPSPRL